MIAVLQRVRRAAVSVDGVTIGEIDRGLVALVGCEVGDGDEQVLTVARKTVELRIFDDDQGKLNLSIQDVSGSVLVISQFTLLGDTRKGRRPSFVRAAPSDAARPLIERYVADIRTRGVAVETGRFGANMLVQIENDGPVTVLVNG
ncbi:MAG: D-aminoacyl-tRNA deacylase [Planctomycetota bacterium]|nr:D-aminoacyl-tRNA deacylase [Planctomycetota bacterium]